MRTFYWTLLLFAWVGYGFASISNPKLDWQFWTILICSILTVISDVAGQEMRNRQ